MQQFRTALGRKDRAAAEQAWMVLTDGERRAFGASPSIDQDRAAIVRVLGPMTVPIMEQCGVDFAGRGSLIELMPVGHIRAVTAFYLGHERKEGTSWKKVTYGWWTDNGNVVLPRSRPTPAVPSTTT